MIEGVERIQAEIQLLVLLVWELNGLPDAHARGRETGSASGVAGPLATRERISHRGNGRGLAGKVLQNAAWIRVDTGFQSCSIEQNGGSVERERRRKRI